MTNYSQMPSVVSPQQLSSNAGERYGTERIKQIWSNQADRYKKIWKECTDVLGRIDSVFIERGQPPQRSENEHEVIMALQDFEYETGYVCAHLGMCSSDVVELARDTMIIESNCECLKLLYDVIRALNEKCQIWAHTFVNGRTHLLPGTMTSIGYRMASTLESLITSYKRITDNTYNIRGIRGAVGNMSALSIKEYDTLNRHFLKILNNHTIKIDIQCACGQVPNRQDILFLSSTWSNVAMQLYKLATDIRISLALGECTVTGKGQASSSLVAKKVNPTHAERVCSIARLIPNHYRAIWDAGANSLFERTLDDSAILRITIEELFTHISQILIDALVMIERYQPISNMDSINAYSELLTVDVARTIRNRVKAQEIVKRDAGKMEIPSLDRFKYIKSSINKISNSLPMVHMCQQCKYAR